MKKKRRTIHLGEEEYVYVMNAKCNQGLSEVVLSISPKDRKNTPCVFHFCTWDDPVTGSPLLVGFPLQNGQTGLTEHFNLHLPSIVKSLVLYALVNGWSGESRIEFMGLEVLRNLGYDVSPVTPNSQTNESLVECDIPK